MILVTGGTGVMGSVLVCRLAQVGHKVRVLTLPDDPFVSRIKDFVIDIRYGDIASANDMSTVCDGVDTVYHLAAVIITFNDGLYRRINRNGTAHLVQAARKSGVQHFIYVSSASVTYPVGTPYSRSKMDAEEIVRNSGMNFTIVRPTLVYDKTGGIEFDLFLDYLKSFPIIPFIGKGDSIKRPVFVNDIIEGLLTLNGNKKTYGKTYNFSGGEPITMYDFARLCLKLLGRQHTPIVHVPIGLCRIASNALKMIMKHPPLRQPVIAGMTQDANLDPTDAIKDLGYKPSRVSEKLPECFPRETTRKKSKKTEKGIKSACCC